MNPTFQFIEQLADLFCDPFCGGFIDTHGILNIAALTRKKSRNSDDVGKTAKPPLIH